MNLYNCWRKLSRSSGKGSTSSCRERKREREGGGRKKKQWWYLPSSLFFTFALFYVLYPQQFAFLGCAYTLYVLILAIRPNIRAELYGHLSLQEKKTDSNKQKKNKTLGGGKWKASAGGNIYKKMTVRDGSKHSPHSLKQRKEKERQ